MSVNVATVLTLPSFRDARILTGSDHLDNVVTQVSITDSPLSEFDFTISKPGDFYLSEFYFARDSAESMLRYLQPIIESNSSGICILDEYISEIPQEVLEFCDSHRLPVILNSVSVPYAQMIREIMELIIADGQNMLLESEFSAIAADTIDEKRKLGILRNLNPHFMSNISVFYIHFKDRTNIDNSLYNLFNSDVCSSALYFRNGLIGLVSYGDSASAAASRIQYYIDKITSSDVVAGAGLSESFLKLHNISKAMNQAIFAGKTALKKTAGSLIRYDQLGIMKLLMLLSDSQELEEFYEDIIMTIKDYDRKNNAQLYETMCTYIRCNYQYRDTAHALFVHENTVRYRISKARELIEAKAPEDDFRETFSIALKCQIILSLSE